MSAEQGLKNLRNKISEWFEKPREHTGGIELSKNLMDEGRGESKLPELVKWIKENDYSKEEVKRVIRRDKAGLKRDAGNEKRFEEEKRNLLKKIEEM